jgi:hypothetical protein
MKTITVVCAQQNGYWAGGVKFPRGSTEIEVSDELMAQIKVDALIGVEGGDYLTVVDGKQSPQAQSAKPADESSAGKPMRK